MTDEQQTDPGGDPSPEASRFAGMLGAFLPIGIVFMTLGIVQGVADRGLPLFILGVSFFTIAMSGVASANRTPDPDAGPPATPEDAGPPTAPEDAGPPAAPSSDEPGPRPPQPPA